MSNVGDVSWVQMGTCPTAVQ